MRVGRRGVPVGDGELVAVPVTAAGGVADGAAAAVGDAVALAVGGASGVAVAAVAVRASAVIVAAAAAVAVILSWPGLAPDWSAPCASSTRQSASTRTTPASKASAGRT